MRSRPAKAALRAGTAGACEDAFVRHPDETEDRASTGRQQRRKPRQGSGGRPERGDEELEERLRGEILRLAHERGPAKTLCPSEAAGAVDPARRQALTQVARAVACTLADEGTVVITQKGVVVDGRTAPGPVRVGLPPPEMRA
jgi:hypothetical protein